MNFRQDFNRRCWTYGLIVAASLGVASGCSGSSAADQLQTVPGQGVVFLDGRPLTQGTITLSPKDSAAGGPVAKRRPAQSAIGPDGSFELSTVLPGDGVLPGDYQVAVVATDQDGTLDPRKLKARPKSLIPEKYADLNRSGLELTIPTDGATALKVELSK